MRHDEHVLPRTVFLEVAHELVCSFANLDSRLPAPRPNHRLAPLECAQRLGIPPFDFATRESRPRTHVEFAQSHVELDRQ